ncbi:SubName: Full=Related to Rho3 GTP binding protein {ECO:0000313/EMBL:CCA75601.1} [Serendipita indica DSM 11827]|nr:SubName: Full=Related to Rho3 GTP binding protein {ECO:0000313/EMBL:CCA75601.1} [Serendipita indica DSM 11827]
MNAHRIVIVGDYGVGRSSLGMRVMEKELPDHISYWGLIEGDPIQVPCFNKIVELDIQVPMSSERYNRLLSLSYTAACAVVFCYSVEDPSSLEYVESQLWLEILHHNPKLPLILVGTKNDLSRKVAVDE